MKTVIIDYGSGNLRSAEKSTVRAAENLDMDVFVTSSPELVGAADRIILPGVGAFADCMSGLCALDGMRDILEEKVILKGTPFLGICVGMQLMAAAGLEHGTTKGLGWLGGTVSPIEAVDLKIPHMGWNDLVIDQADHPVLEGIKTGEHAYFVHSYHFDVENDKNNLAHVEYGGYISAVVGRDNMVGTQFHPEKSQSVGIRLIENFLKWSP